MINRFEDMTYQELKYYVDNLHNLYYDKTRVDMKEYFNKIEPDKNGSILCSLKYYYDLKYKQEQIEKKLKQLGI